MSDTKKVKVRAVGHLFEGEHRNPGDVFEVSAARAKALGPSVKILTKAEAEALTASEGNEG